MRILVTGSTGFVGSHVLQALVEIEGVEVIAACRDRAGLLPEFSGEVREGDLRDPDYVQQVVQGVDVICHAAAWTSAWGHAAKSKELFLAPSLALVDAAIEANVGRFIFLSSTSVAAPLRSRNGDAMGDDHRLRRWPHLRNVARIENHMRQHADRGTQMTSLRVGIFAGERYGIGILSLLVPRLKTHLVPWVAGGKTGLPMIAGSDIGHAFACAGQAGELPTYCGINIVGPEVPRVRDVIGFLAKEYHLPKPHFGVPFFAAYAFGQLMEWLDPIVSWEPLVTRSIVHLLEETAADNDKARTLLGYAPQVHWQDAIRMQMAEMAVRQTRPMSMTRPVG